MQIGIAEIIKIKGINYLVWPIDQDKNSRFMSIPINIVQPDMYEEVTTKYYEQLYSK